jgi:4-carboxymuconolactone decarboxylase
MDSRAHQKWRQLTFGRRPAEEVKAYVHVLEEPILNCLPIQSAVIPVVREMMGDQAAAKLSSSADSDTFGAPIAAYAVDQVFADIWTRPGLDRRSRSLVAMSVMIAMRQPHEFAIHMGAGLNNGLTLKEIEEVLIQALPYVGYPAIATALAAAAEVIKERGLDVDKNYTGHRGLL